jgi:hypothetical protein
VQYVVFAESLTSMKTGMKLSLVLAHRALESVREVQKTISDVLEKLK